MEKFELPEIIPHPTMMVDNPEYQELIDRYADHLCREADCEINGGCAGGHLSAARALVNMEYKNQTEAERDRLRAKLEGAEREGRERVQPLSGATAAQDVSFHGLGEN